MMFNNMMNHFEELNSLDPGGKMPAPTIEMPTPHRIAVLILMKQFLSEKKMQAESGLFYPPQVRRKFCLLLLKLIQYPDLSYNEFHNMLTSSRYKIGNMHLEAFEKAMSDMFATGIEALFDFGELQNIEKMLCEEWGVSQFSIMGVYIRRVGVVLERLSFPEMVALYKNICLYYERGARVLALGPRGKMVPGGVLHRSKTNAPIVEEVGDEKDESTAKGEPVTTTDLPEPEQETDDSKHSSVLSKNNLILDRNPLCKWSPKQAKLFVSQQSELLENNELRALSPKALQRRLNEISKDNPLMSSPYFLSYMNQLRVRDYFNAVDALHRAFDRCPVRMMSQEKGFQYFCVNLAVLHASFGHCDEAITALNESIMLAQENGDKRSLNLANTWYCMLTNEDPKILTKKIDTDAPLLQANALALQYSVKVKAAAGYPPISLFDLLHRSDEILSKNNMLENITDSLAMRSAVWSVYGRHEIASLYSQMLLNMNKKLVFGDVSNTEGVASALSSFTLWLYLQGEKHFAQILLQHARQSFPRHPNSESWMISQCHIAIQDGIYRCRWHDALKACDQLYLFDEADGLLQRATIFLAKRYYDSARLILIELREDTKLSLLMKVRVLILLAYCSFTEKKFSSEAVQLLLTASEETKAAQMDYEHALVDVALAQLLLSFNSPQKAFQTIKSALDVVHINGCLYDRAKTDFVFVRCLMAVAGSDLSLQKTHLRQSVSILERVVASFKRLQAHAKVLDVYLYLAKGFHTIGDREIRNKYSREFRRYHTEHPIAREYLDSAY